MIRGAGRAPVSPPRSRNKVRRALRTRLHMAAVLIALLLVVRPCSAWESWGGDAGGSRFSPLRQITPDNVGQLVRAFEYRTGDLPARSPELMRRTKFEATPLFVEDSLIFCSPFNEVIALDPGTGVQKWRYDPKIATNQRPANRYVCRGVTWWIDDQAPANAVCRSRIFMGTNDVRLIALDAKTGIPCAGFGNGGEIKLDIGMPLDWPGEFQITSPPAVGRGVVVVGSAIGDSVVAFRLARPGEGPSPWSHTIDRPGGRFVAGSTAIALAIIALVIAGLRWRRRRRIMPT